MAAASEKPVEPRVPLSRGRILDAALAIADEQGIEALSMRKLGQALGFEALSLYNYVANKDDLLNGLLDVVLDETKTPSPDEPWDEAIRASAVSVHDALRRHTWAPPFLMSGSHVRPARLRYMDSLLGRLRTAGFDADTTYHAYHVLDGHIFGFSQWETAHSSYTPSEDIKMRELFDSIITADAYPHLREHGEQHFAEGPHRHVSAFEFGLDLILDGLRPLRDGTV
jgi:AcrR family transcriptional regulator